MKQSAIVHKRPPAVDDSARRDGFGKIARKKDSTWQNCRRARGSRTAGRGDGRAARRRRHGSVRCALPQGNHRRARRCAIAHTGGAPELFARTRRTSHRNSQLRPRAGQARCRIGSSHSGGRQQGPSRRHLSAVQAEATHQGRDRQGGGAGAACRRVAGPAGERSAFCGRIVRQCRQRGGRRRSRARWRARHFGRTLRRRRRPDRRAARRDVVTRPDGLQCAQGQENRGREVQGLFRFQRAAHQAAVAPHPGDVPRRKGRNPRPADAARALERDAGRLQLV